MKSLAELETNKNHNEDEIDLKQIFEVITKNKKLIAIITLFVFLLSLIYAYFSTNIYSTYSTIEIPAKSQPSMPTEIDIFAGGLGGDQDLHNEIEVLQSRELLLKLLEIAPLNIRYFSEGLLKNKELYTNKPFDLNITKSSNHIAGNVVFKIDIIDNKSYNIEVKFKNNNKQKIELGGVYNFGQTVKTDYLTFNLNKTKYLSKSNGSFKIIYTPNIDNFIDSFIRTNLGVAPINKDASVVKLTYSDNDAARGVDILNSLVKLYFTQKLDLQQMETKSKLKFIDDQLKITYADLANSEKSLKDYKQKNTIASIPNSSTVLLNQIVDTDTQKSQIDIKLNILQGLMDQIKSTNNISTVSIDALGLQASPISTMIMSLQQKSAAKNALLVDYTNQHPDVLRTSKEIDELKRSIKGSINSLYASTKKQQSDLQTSKNLYENTLQQMPAQELNLLNLNRSFQVNEKMYSYLLEKKSEFEIMNASAISQNRILDRAILYPEPIKPKRSLIAISGLLLGLLLGMVVALIRNFMDKKISSVADIERITNIPIYGVLPQNKEVVAFNESFNMLRTNIEFSPSKDKCKVVIITSNIPGEGKTTISSNLAKTLAKAGKKTILLDFDLRKSALNREFPELVSRNGMSQLLANMCGLKDVVISAGEYLDVVFSGKVPPNPSELLLSNTIDDIIGELKNRYDYIILDTAPIGLVTDAMILNKKHLHDIFLVTSRANYTDKALIENFNKLAHRHHMKSLGFIINDVKIDSGYGYGYGYTEK